MNTSARSRLPDPSRYVAWAGPALIASTAVAMLIWSWGHWPDVLIDFGRELYVPWRLGEGAVLYRDISYFNGPLSPYFNSLCFAIFGVSLRSLALVNIALVSLLAVLLYRILVSISGRFEATIACVVFFTLFAFGQLDTIGNYNYVSPYSHEATHGLLLSFLAITALATYPQRRKLALAAAGFALGLVSLTKTEMFLAAGAAMGACLALNFWAHRVPARAALGSLTVFAAAALLPPLLALAGLSLVMPFDTALHGLLDPFTNTFNPEVTSLSFYRWGMGTLFLDESLTEFAKWTGMYAALFLPAAALALALRRPGAHRWWIAAVVAGLILALLRIDPLWEWTRSVKPLPLFLLVIGVLQGVALVRELRRQADPTRSILSLTFTVFALALLAKIVLNARLTHYGFALAMPASMLLVVALIGWAPRLIDRHRGFAPVFLAAALSSLLVAEVSLLLLMKHQFELRMTQVAHGADAFLAGERGDYVSLALTDIAARTEPEDTLVVLPEGIMINYLTRRRNPTPYTNFMPPELLLYGEERILDEFRAHPPDYVLIVHKFTGEYGFPFFGRNYGKALYHWVRQHYQVVQLYGLPPLQKIPNFGILVLQQIAPEQTSQLRTASVGPTSP